MRLVGSASAAFDVISSYLRLQTPVQVQAPLWEAFKSPLKSQVRTGGRGGGRACFLISCDERMGAKL